MFVDDVDVVPFVEGFCVSIVEFVVEDCATPVFHCIFKCCDGENYNNWNCSKTRIRCAKDGEYLQTRYCLSTYVGEEREGGTCKITMKKKYMFATLWN